MHHSAPVCTNHAREGSQGDAFNPTMPGTTRCHARATCGLRGQRAHVPAFTGQRKIASEAAWGYRPGPRLKGVGVGIGPLI